MASVFCKMAFFLLNAVLVWLSCLQNPCTLFICAIKCAWLADSTISGQNVYSANIFPFII